jgi:hypothetical protein
MTDETHSTHEMVRGLHARFDALEEWQKQTNSRIGKLETGLAADVAHLEKHEAEAELKGVAVLDKLNTLVAAFQKHADREDADRRWLMGLVLTTLLASVGGLMMMVL